MKGKGNFGYKFIIFIALVVAIANAAARDFRNPFDDYEAPEPDTPATKKADTQKLRFPIYDHTGAPGETTPSSMDLQDPRNVKKEVTYDPNENRYYFSEKMGDQFLRNPSYMTMDEYLDYQGAKDEQAYWKRRLDALTLFNQKPQLPQMYKEGIFDRIFGGNTISVRPQGNVDVTVGGNWQNIKNPTLVQRAQKYGMFDFDMQMNINLLATVGDKLKLNISNNTKATFDYQNIQRLEYTGKEDEIIKKIEAGNISFPLNSSLISGVQSLFGLKTQLQFGKLWVTGVLSQQKSKRQSLTIQGGSQTQQFALKADEYEENRHFLLGQYFRNNYNRALANFPIINSQVTINKIEVWVTNRTGATEGVRTVVGLMDLAEANPYNATLNGQTRPIPSGLPDNRANNVYDRLQQNPQARVQGLQTSALLSLGLSQNTDFAVTTARKLNASEFSFNPQIGYISLNTQINPDDILCVAYRYTYNGKLFQVGEFAEDLPPSVGPGGQPSANQPVLFMKLLKGLSFQPTLPIWDLMMKNVYPLGGLGVSKDEFRLNVLYQDPGGGEKRYLPEGPRAGTPLITILNLDRLNFQNDPAPDGIFDFVEGITINTQQGKIIFPVLEPFGEDLRPAIGPSSQLATKYLYTKLYDSTKTIARQFQQNNRFVIKGSYKSASSSEIFLGGFNIPQGSVSVSAGGQRLVENVDYQIDYGLGRLKILNSGILNSGIPINVQYEDNATFGFQQQNFMGARLDYYLNNNLALGGTYMRLTERPFTQKTTFGEDPIKNTVLGFDANYQSEAPGITRLLDKLPLYSTTSPSFINATGEVAGLLPGHPQQIDQLDREGAVYVDDFEGTRSSYDLKFPANAWTLASTPAGAVGPNGQELFPEAANNNSLDYGYNRAKLAWYFIEPTLVDGTGSSGIPGYVKSDPNQHYIRLVQQQEVFPQRSNNQLQNALSTLDLAFYPDQRGPYNFDARNIQPDGKLNNPELRWGGITRAIDYSDFEQSNVEFVEFWLMDPFINNPTAQGGYLYVNLGSISEDVLKDGKKSFENGIPYPKDVNKLDTDPVWGVVPQFSQQITRAFDNDEAARAVQDVGYDGLDNEEEKAKFAQYLNNLTGQALAAAQADPAADDYHYFRGTDYDQQNLGVLARYKNFNNPQGNSPIAGAGANFSQAATNIPESEDINRDNTLSDAEDYYQYRVDMSPGALQVGTNYIISKQVTNVKLPNGTIEPETWYQFKIPIREYSDKVGSISDFRAIRFIRLFLNGFKDSTILRFARLELGRNQWRRYDYSLKRPGENIPPDELERVKYAVTSVSVEENSDRQPVPYVIPPGVQRQLQAVATGQNIQQNEQSISLQVCDLDDGNARAVYKEVSVDMRQFAGLRMFIHAEAQTGQTLLKDGDMRAFIRIGSDFTNNYYEYQIPMKVTSPGSNNAEDIWPMANRLDLILDELVKVKTERNSRGLPSFTEYTATDAKGNIITVLGNPNLGEAKTIMLGVRNPEKNSDNPNDDGLPKCIEVWFDELRMTGLNEKPGYAAAGKVTLQMADLGNLNLAGSMHTEGYGNIDQKLNQRFRDNYYQYNASTNLNMGKLMPRRWGVQLPLFVGYSENISNPQYDPYDLDVKYKDKLNSARDAEQRDSMRKIAQDFTSITSVNLSNVRIVGNPDKQSAKSMPWSIKNFDVSYAYNKQFKRNPIIESDELVNQKAGLGYTYNIKSRPIEPFKSLVKSRSKWLSLVKDVNLNLLPANFTFRTDLNRTVEETKVRNVSGDPIDIQPTFFKNFLWNRTYATRWELTRSLSFDYGATNISRIDEPYGRINTSEKRDSLWDRVKTFGRNTFYQQNFNASYNLPFQKLPLTDWMNLRLTYGATYSWTAASQLARDLGNTINNTQTKQANGDLNFTQLYNKNRWLRAVNQPKARGGAPKKEVKSLTPSGRQAEQTRSVKDLRPSRENESVSAEPPKNENEDVSPAPPNPDEAPKQLSLPDLEKDKNKKQQSKEDSMAVAKAKADSTIEAITSKMTNQQLDSFNKARKAEELAKKKAEKAKKKKERKLARQKRRNSTPEVSDGERAAGRLLTMVKRTVVNYTENAGTVLPGYVDSTRLMGMNRMFRDPGFDFIYGYQPDAKWFEQKAIAGLLSRDTLFNAQIQQQYTQNITVTTTLEPVTDFRVDVSFTRAFSKTHNELFKDTTLTGYGEFTHNNPYETGSFSVSYIGLGTMFKPSAANSGTYQRFLDNRAIVSRRLGENNPYTNRTPDPNNPNYQKGYTEFSQDVLIPAFVAAYSGKSANDVALIDYSSSNLRSNPFKYYYPKPNWRVSYTGLTKIPAINKVMNNLVVNHNYTGTLAMNSFISALYYQDLFALGYPSFIDSNSGNYVPFFQVPNITISEQLSPLFGFDASFRNGFTGRFEFNKSRMVSLSLIDYQVSETKSTEYRIGAGYRIRGLVLPFEIFGVRKLNNDLNIKFDVSVRDDITTNNYLAQNLSVITRGQKVIQIQPSIDYIVSDKLTLRFFYDRRQSIPYVTSSFPITTTRAGLTLRFIFAQ